MDTEIFCCLQAATNCAATISSPPTLKKLSTAEILASSTPSTLAQIALIRSSLCVNGSGLRC